MPIDNNEVENQIRPWAVLAGPLRWWDDESTLRHQDGRRGGRLSGLQLTQSWAQQSTSRAPWRYCHSFGNLRDFWRPAYSDGACWYARCGAKIDCSHRLVAGVQAGSRHPNERSGQPRQNCRGLANVIQKSLGGAKKGGNAPLMDVYEYAHALRNFGLELINMPCYYLVSRTGQIACGANMNAFTTSRG